MYHVVKSVIDDMAVKEVKDIDMPEDIRFFRKYLSEISRKEQKKFQTKNIGYGKLRIVRVPYFNILKSKKSD